MSPKKTNLLPFLLLALFFLPINVFAQQSVAPLHKERLNKINPEVQLQENGWIKIVEIAAKEMTGIEYSESRLPYVPGMQPLEQRLKDSDDPRDEKVYEMLKNKKMKILRAKIQFLQPCKATKKLKEDGHEVSGGIEGMFADEEYTVPSFRCNYRNKIFSTFFASKGYEIRTEGIFPYAQATSLSGLKTEMLPGETMWTEFIVPEDAESWAVWVPK